MPCGTKKEKADLSAASSAAQGSLFKEDIPRKINIAEDNTLMGRLASRMAARDYIDKQNLGMGTAAQKAAVADAPTAPMAPKAKMETGKNKNFFYKKMKRIHNTKMPGDAKVNSLIETNIEEHGSKKEKKMLGMADNYPTKVSISGPAVKEGRSVEREHDTTIGKVITDSPKGKMDKEKVAEMIAKDHLQEDPNYYKKLKSLKL